MERNDREEARFPMTDKVYKSKRRIMLTFSIPMGGYLLYRLFQLAPQFFPALGTVVLITAALALGYQFTRRRVAMKCPQCGGPMENMGDQKVYRGSHTPDGRKLDSLGKRVYRCDDCGNEYHELVYFMSSYGDAADHRQEVEAEAPRVLLFKTEAPGGRMNFDMKEDTVENYRRIKRELADKVILHNRRNGFDGDPIKIDLEE